MVLQNDNQKSLGHFYETHAKEHNPKLPTNDVAVEQPVHTVINWKPEATLFQPQTRVGPIF